MVAHDERSSDYESNDTRAHGNGGYNLDQTRRAALAEVDNAKFSFVYLVLPLEALLTISDPFPPVGSMPKSVSLQALVSSPMRPSTSPLVCCISSYLD